MRSQVTFFVEHGDTTDPLDDFIKNAESVMYSAPGCEVQDYDVIVDIP